MNPPEPKLWIGIPLNAMTPEQLRDNIEWHRRKLAGASEAGVISEALAETLETVQAHRAELHRRGLPFNDDAEDEYWGLYNQTHGKAEEEPTA
jgi:hypothetical protein